MAEVTTGEIAHRMCMAEVMNLLEAEPTTPVASGGVIPPLREQHAVLVSTRKAKEAIGV